jgi:SRSO17 transposase
MVRDRVQALQNFINQSPWDEQKLWRRFRNRLALHVGRPGGVLVIKDLTFAKRGRRSVGVHRQYCPATGKKTNCQTAVSIHYVSGELHVPLALRLYLPQEWQSRPERLKAARVPEVYCRSARKWQIALELLDELRAEGFPVGPVVADVRYGAAAEFRDGLDARGLDYLIEVSADEPLSCFRLAVGATQRMLPEVLANPLATAGELGGLALTSCSTSHPGADHDAFGRQAWVELPLKSAQTLGGQAGRPPSWLWVAEEAGGLIRYALSNVKTRDPSREALQLWMCRQITELGCQRMRDWLGLDHFEGRSWLGFHHHACLVMLAYGFLVLNQRTSGGAWFRDQAVRVSAEEMCVCRGPCNAASP